MRSSKSLISLLLITLVLPLSLSAREKERERLEHAGNVMQEILNIPDGIPKELLDRAECVVVLPSVKKFAIGIGGSFGRGAMVCRSGEHFTGSWGAPAMYALEQRRAGLTKDFYPMQFPGLIGVDMAGTVVKIGPRVETLPLSEASEAQAAPEKGGIGKILLVA